MGKLSTRLTNSDSLTSNDFWITITGEITFSHHITKSCAAAKKSCAADTKSCAAATKSCAAATKSCAAATKSCAADTKSCAAAKAFYIM